MKNVFKKVLFSLGAIGLVGAGSFGMVSAQSLLGGNTENVDANASNATYQGQTMDYNPGSNTNQLKKDNLIKTIRNFINRVLGLLSLIALAICLWGGFQMLTANGDETKYKKGFTILKQAGFGLAIIALAWLIVSVVFRVVNKTAEGGTSSGGQA